LINSHTDLIIREDLAIEHGTYNLLESLKKLIKEINKDPTVRNLYIGIASGHDAKHALKRRHDRYKKDNGINEMILLCRRNTQDKCRDVEKYLTTNVNNELLKEELMYDEAMSMILSNPGELKRGTKPGDMSSYVDMKVIVHRASGGQGRPCKKENVEDKDFKYYVYLAIKRLRKE